MNIEQLKTEASELRKSIEGVKVNLPEGAIDQNNENPCDSHVRDPGPTRSGRAGPN